MPDLDALDSDQGLLAPGMAPESHWTWPLDASDENSRRFTGTLGVYQLGVASLGLKWCTSKPCCSCISLAVFVLKETYSIKLKVTMFAVPATTCSAFPLTCAWPSSTVILQIPTAWNTGKAKLTMAASLVWVEDHPAKRGPLPVSLRPSTSSQSSPWGLPGLRHDQLHRVSP